MTLAQKLERNRANLLGPSQSPTVRLVDPYEIRQAYNEQAILDHEIAVLQGLVDRNGYHAVLDWLNAYKSELDREEQQRNDEFFRWGEGNAYFDEF